MASIRTIKVGRAKLKWNTGASWAIYYDPKNIQRIFDQWIEPALKNRIRTKHDIRDTVFEFVEGCILDCIVSTMKEWVNLVMALRLTEIYISFDDNVEFADIRLVHSGNTLFEDYTFHNIIWHMNHHCRQLWRCCFVNCNEVYHYRKAICYTHGDGYDRYDYFLDHVLEKDKDKYKWSSQQDYSTFYLELIEFALIDSDYLLDIIQIDILSNTKLRINSVILDC